MKILIIDHPPKGYKELEEKIRKSEVESFNGICIYFINKGHKRPKFCGNGDDPRKCFCENKKSILPNAKTECNTKCKIMKKIISCNDFDYIIWHPGRCNTIKDYKNLLKCNGQSQISYKPKVIFVSEGAINWSTVKQALKLIYGKINACLNNSGQCNGLIDLLEGIYGIEQKEMDNNCEINWKEENGRKKYYCNHKISIGQGVTILGNLTEKEWKVLIELRKKNDSK